MKRNKIYTGDCAEVLAGFPDACIDLTVTSPPYDNLRDYEGFTFDFEAIANQLFRVTKKGGVVVWVVGDKKENGNESLTSLKQAIYFQSLGFNAHDTMIYRKKNGAMGANNEYLQEFEFMFVFSRGIPKSVNLIRDRKNIVSGKTSTVKTKSSTGGASKERHIVDYAEFGRRKNIWDYGVGGRQAVGYHPAPFPEALARDHIISWSNPGNVVLDPMCGSGTTLKMAVQTGRDYVGIDTAAKYVKIAEKRVAGANVPLF